MPVGYLSDPELARLNAWPDEIAAEDAVTYFTLSSDDLAWLTGFNRVENRLGVAVQLSTLPWLGWIPDDLAACPAAALERLATAHAIDSNTAVELLRAYGGVAGRDTSQAPGAGARPARLALVRSRGAQATG